MSNRKTAFDILSNWLKNKAYINKLMNLSVQTKNINNNDLAFLNRLCVGVVERKLELDYIISLLSNTPLKKIKPDILVILEMGIYQLKYMDKQAEFAVCNEMINLTKKLGYKGLSGYVNAILRNYIRQKSDIHEKYPKKDINIVNYLSIAYSMPEWIVQHYLNEIGYEASVIAFEYFLNHNTLCVRAVKSKINTDELIKLFEQEDIRYKINPYLDYVFEIIDASKLMNSDILRLGYVQVQDFSSILIAEAANVNPCMNVLDICAAPGGKTLHLSDLMYFNIKSGVDNKLGKIYAKDLHEFKIEQLNKRISDSGFENIVPVCEDATVLSPDETGKYELIIADLPCSGLGVIGKKPDIKYYTTQTDIDDLSLIQRKILTNACEYLKPKGRLIYSTCTISKKENKDISDFALRELGLKPYAIKDNLPSKISCDMSDNWRIEILPGQYLSDGFFIAGFVKS